MMTDKLCTLQERIKELEAEIRAKDVLLAAKRTQLEVSAHHYSLR